MAKKSKFKLRDSDRSGFTYKDIDLVKDKGSLVGPDEFDTPPPSNKSLGGEELISNPDARQNATTSYAQIVFRPTQFVTAADGITFPIVYDSQGKFDTNNQWIYVAGSNSQINITKNPQVSAGYQNALLTIQCVGSTIILETGSGLDLRSNFNMTSGAILNLVFSATDNLWHETNRGHLLGGI